MADGLVLIGAVLGAFGVRGELRVRSFTADPAAIGAYGPLYDTQGALVFTPVRVRPAGEAFAVTAKEPLTREQAQALRGTGLHVPRTVLPPAEEDEYYHVDLIGRRVESLAGEVLGVVRSVQDFGAGELLEVKPPEGPSWYLPFTKAAVPVVDLQAGRIVSAEGPPRAEGEEPSDPS